MKVYCKNCEHYERRQSSIYCPANKNTVFDRCMKLTEIYRDVIGDLRLKKPYVDCNVQNKDFHCEHYKRKWWKFWIKNRLRTKAEASKIWKLVREDLKKSYIHKRPKPNKKSPTKRPSKQNKRKKR